MSDPIMTAVVNALRFTDFAVGEGVYFEGLPDPADFMSEAYEALGAIDADDPVSVLIDKVESRIRGLRTAPQDQE